MRLARLHELRNSSLLQSPGVQDLGGLRNRRGSPGVLPLGSFGIVGFTITHQRYGAWDPILDYGPDELTVELHR